MAENKIELKSINELLGMKFFIPLYQRGYRWTEQQVKDLLNDIWEFSKKKKQEYEFYCLQPLVVKLMSDEEKTKCKLDNNDEWYEVIDGQQRLTTVSLFLAAIYTRLRDYKAFMDEDDEDILPALRKSLKSGLSPNEMNTFTICFTS